MKYSKEYLEQPARCIVCGAVQGFPNKSLVAGAHFTRGIMLSKYKYPELEVNSYACENCKESINPSMKSQEYDDMEAVASAFSGAQLIALIIFLFVVAFVYIFKSC